MGAGAAKQYQSDKTRHAEIVFEAVRAYEAAHPNEYNNDYAHLQTFKTRVQLAAVDAKRKGKDIDSSLAQLSDADFETLRKFVEDSWRQKEEDRKRKNDNAVMTVEEFVEEDPNLNDNAQDETTSVLSYGDGEEGQGEEADSDGEIDSSHSLLLGKSKSRDDDDEKLESSGEIVEDLENHNEPSIDHGRAAAVKIFPMDVATDMATLGYTTPNRKGPKQQSTPRMEETKEMGIADALAKFWEIDEIGSIQSQLNLGTESPRAGSFSPFSPDVRSSRRSFESAETKERNKHLDERNERLMGLQRKKVMSFTQNAQLEREVEVLQRQLERMDELDRAAGIMDDVPYHATPIRLHNSMQNSASTIYSSANNTPIQSNNAANLLSANRQGNSHHQPSKLSYIYPIDEEANDWNNSIMGTPDAKVVPNSNRQLQQQQHRAYYQNGKDKKNSMTSSSSSDEDSVSNRNKNNQVQGRKPPGPPPAAQSGIKQSSNNRQARLRAEDKMNPSSSGSSIHNTPAAVATNSNVTQHSTDGKSSSNVHVTPNSAQQDKNWSSGGGVETNSSSHNKNLRGGRRIRYRNSSNAGEDSDDSASNNKSNYFTPTSNSKLAGISSGDRDNNAARKNASTNSNNAASDSDTNSQVMPLSARGAANKNNAGNIVPSNNSGKKAGPKLSLSSGGVGGAAIATASSSSLDSSVAMPASIMNGNMGNSPLVGLGGMSPIKRHSDARRARNTIQTENDHKSSPTNASSKTTQDPSLGNINRRAGNMHSEDEHSVAGSKGPSKNTALKRLNKRRHSADGLPELTNNNENPKFTHADESQIKALIEKQISDLAHQQPVINLQSLSKKISNRQSLDDDYAPDAKKIQPDYSQEKANSNSGNLNPNSRNHHHLHHKNRHPASMAHPSENPHFPGEDGVNVLRPSNAPNARQQGSGMLSDHDFDALFAAVDTDPDAALSPHQKQQEVYRQQKSNNSSHNPLSFNTGSSVTSVMSAALATGSQQLPEGSFLTSTNTNVTISDEQAGSGHHSLHSGSNHHHGHHNHGHHGRHHNHHQQQQNHQITPTAHHGVSKHVSENKLISIEDMSPSQTQNHPNIHNSNNNVMNNNPNTAALEAMSMAAAAAVVTNVQNLKKRAGKGARHHGAGARNVGNSNAGSNENGRTEEAVVPVAAAPIEKEWTEELDHAYAALFIDHFYELRLILNLMYICN